MIVNIIGEIGNEAFEKLISVYNELKEGQTLTIYLHSGGGSVEAMESIIDLITTNKDKTTLIAYGEICSAAFDIFFRSNCERDILRGTTGMAHYTGINVNIISKTKVNKSDKGYVEWNKIEMAYCLKFYEKLGFNKSELKSIKEGKDVFFQTGRLVEFLNNQENFNG